MHNPSLSIPALIGNLLLAFLFSCPAGAQTISDTEKGVNAHGDHGYWQTDQPDVMILWPEDDRNIVRRFSGSAQHPYPYRLWVSPDRAGGFPVLLKDEPAFNNFLEHIKSNQDKDWCQLAETWSAWTGDPPSGCGVRSYRQQRSCSVPAAAERPCPELCNPAVETRARQVDNGPCSPEPPPRNTCPLSDWTPATGSVCAGESFTQTRTLADCSSDTRRAVGSGSCTRSCTVTAWSPARNLACSGETLVQTRTLADCSTENRTVNGARSCPSSCPVSAWMPPASTVCSGQTLTQTRTRTDCSTESRTVSGAGSCPSSCPVSAWAPSASTVCSGQTFTQTRTRTDCSTESRTASGARSCPPSCPVTAWTPSPSTVCVGETLTQTRTRADCSAASRTVGGAKPCPPSCPVTAWTPSPSTVCSGQTFTQSRTGADCSAETRTASGTKNCAPSCTYWCSAQNTGGFLGTLWIRYKRCTGDTHASPTGTYATSAACHASLP